MDIKQIVFLIVFVATIFVFIREMKTVPKGQISQNPLAKQLKVIIWILCILNPIIAGTILYYGWRKRMPIMAHQANQISLWAFLILLVIGIGVFLIFPQAL